MGFFTDPRSLLSVFFAIATIAYFLYRNYSYTGRWSTSGEGRDFQWWEAVIMVGLFLLLNVPMWYWGRDNRIRAYNEQIGGFVTAHYSQDGSHEESHESCSGTGDDRHCTTYYTTEYHREFFVETNIGARFPRSKWYERVNKPNENSEPYRIPQFYTDTYVGKAVSFDNTYPNYVAAANEDYFRNTYNALADSFPDICPETPDIRYNDTSVLRILPIGFNQDAPVRHEIYSWNIYQGSPDWFMVNGDKNLALVPLYGDTLFGYLGGKVQGDVHVYVMNTQNVLYADMCMAKWRNGAKNSIYVFIFGLPDASQSMFIPTDAVVKIAVDGSEKNTGLKMENEESRSNYYLKQDIRNQLLDYFKTGGTLNRESILRIVSVNVNNTFVRQEMAKFEKLKEFVVPTKGWMIFMSILTAIVMTIGCFILSNNDF